MDIKPCVKTADIGNCPVDENGNIIVTPTPEDNGACKELNGLICLETERCSNFDLSKSNDSCIIDGYVQESLEIGGAPFNIYRLLGVHEQGKLQDVTGRGTAISGGDHPNFPALNAFDIYNTKWQSAQVGPLVTTRAFLGYDFGEFKLNNDRIKYGVETFVKRDISSIKIKQSSCTENRVTKIRIERSPNGKKWYGVQIVDVPDCDGLVTINFSRSVPSRFWRIRPVNFNGGINDHWEIKALQLIEYEATNLQNIQDKIFMENRDRDYDELAIFLKGSYTPVDTQSFLSRFGFDGLANGDQYFIEFNFNSLVQSLGRPMVIGDILEIPSEAQYSPSLKAIKKYVEVTDVAWSTTGFTPNWRPTLQRIIAQPVLSTQETQDILGKLTQDSDELGLVDIDDGGLDKPYQDIANIDQTINADADTDVPVRGKDYSNVQKLSKDVYDWAEKYHPNLKVGKLDRTRHVLGIDAMPPNGEDFGRGDKLPSTATATDGEYFRLEQVVDGIEFPARLYKFSSVKQRWIYLETDERGRLKGRTVLQDFIDPERND